MRPVADALPGRASARRVPVPRLGVQRISLPIFQKYKKAFITRYHYCTLTTIASQNLSVTFFNVPVLASQAAVTWDKLHFSGGHRDF